METSMFIGSSEKPTAPYCSSELNRAQTTSMKHYALIVLVVLATAGISAGITFQCTQTQIASTGSNNHVKTPSRWERKITHEHSAEYEVFTVPKDGNYFIHGLIWKSEEKQKEKSIDYVWLLKKLRSYVEIANTTFCGSHASFACELQNIKKTTKIYVRFNTAKPDPGYPEVLASDLWSLLTLRSILLWRFM